jgi:phosphoserine phosphatase RsbU/P
MPQIRIKRADGASRDVALSKEAVTIGRSHDRDIFLSDQWLSRHHAEIRRRSGGFFLSDMGSKNGTLLNGTKIQETVRLKPGDVITLGEHTLHFVDEDTTTADESALVGSKIFKAREISDMLARAEGQALGVRQSKVIEILRRAAEQLVVYHPLDELFGIVLKLLFEAVPAERGAILVLEDGEPVIKGSLSREGEAISSVSRSIIRKVLEDRVSLLLPNVLENADFRASDSILSSGVRSAVCTPLWIPDGAQENVIGLVYLDCRRRAHAFSEEDLGLVTALANVAAAKIANARLLEESLEKRRLERDILIAADIQTSLLPSAAPSLPGYSVAGSNRPCHTVGGDYFDFELEPDRLLLALGDVSGKGVGAALLMTVLRASVRGRWSEGSLAEAVAHINRTVCQNVPLGKYMTCFFGRLTPSTGGLSYVNAGHNAPLIVRADGRVDALEDGGTVLGLFESSAYQEGTAELGPGDALFVFSDGVTETFAPDGGEFGEEGLRQIALSCRGLDAPELETAILRDLERYSAGGKPTDDRTLIVVKRA